MSANDRVIPLAALEHLISSAERRILDCDQRIAELTEKRGMLQGELRALAGLRKLAESPSSPIVNGKLKPRAAILELIAQNPGLTSKEVVDRLEHRVQSKAGDIRRNLHVTLYTLRKRGVVVQTRGKLRLAENVEGSGASRVRRLIGSHDRAGGPVDS